ncbi:MAG: LLM class F420-dependent oxidoreductase [bacterium]
MKLGAIFPQTEIGNDVEQVKTFFRGVEELGFNHVLSYEHVLGVDPNYPGFDGIFDINDSFHEPLTLFSHAAGITRDLEFFTGVLVLPQRQTPLVAKQVAELDIVSNGRFHLGIGVGWNEHEYEAMGYDFSTRGIRIEEQIQVLRKLWEEKSVTFDGRWHTLEDVGLTMSPVSDSIPIWMGGMADAVIDRTVRMADGWLPQFEIPGDNQTRDYMDRLEHYCEQYDREVNDIGLHPRIKLSRHEPDRLKKLVQGWNDLGATHLTFNTLYMNLQSAEEHLDKLERTLSRIDRYDYIS